MSQGSRTIILPRLSFDQFVWFVQIAELTEDAFSLIVGPRPKLALVLRRNRRHVFHGHQFENPGFFPRLSIAIRL